MSKLPAWTNKHPGLQYYACSSGSSHKFWAIWSPTGTYRFRTFWGRIGNNPQETEKVFHSGWARDDVADKLIQSKLNKGYKLAGKVADDKNPVLKMEPATIKPGKPYVAPPEPMLGNSLDYLDIE